MRTYVEMVKRERHSTIDKILNGEYDSFFLIAGPCAVESYETCIEVGQHMKHICEKHDIPYIFKASYRKANRTSGNSFKGIGDDLAIDILRRIRGELGIPVTTDIHEVADIDLVADVVDMIQIPAFLCRQTDLLQAAGATGLPVNIKKGQFMSGAAMQHAVQKVSGNNNGIALLTERGNSFGYGDLVVDARNLDVMSRYATVIMDCTHATQRPNQVSGVTGGNPDEIALFARLGLMSGASGLFVEVHPDPASALSDGASMLHLAAAESLITGLKALSLTYKEHYA